MTLKSMLFCSSLALLLLGIPRIGSASPLAGLPVKLEVSKPLQTLATEEKNRKLGEQWESDFETANRAVESFCTKLGWKCSAFRPVRVKLIDTPALFAEQEVAGTFHRAKGESEVSVRS